MPHSFICELLKAIKLDNELTQILSGQLTLTPRDALENTSSNCHALGLAGEDLDRIWLRVPCDCEENAEIAGMPTAPSCICAAGCCKKLALGSTATSIHCSSVPLAGLIRASMPGLHSDSLQLSNNNGLAIGWGVRQELGNNNTASSRKFGKQMLVAHNEYRAVHHSPPLTINEDLSRMAQTWAEVLASKDALAYDVKCDRLGIGENVARKCDITQENEPTAQEFVDTWYGEVSNFNWRSLEDQYNCSHFAQLVWRSSREVGFGRAISASGCVYVVGRYKPRGITSGEFPRNVMPRSVKPAQSPADQEKRDIPNRRNITNMMANKLLPPKRVMMEAAAPTPSELPPPPSANSPEIRHRSFSGGTSRTSQDKLVHLNRELQSRTSAPQDRLGQLNREAQSRTSAPHDKLGQLNREVQSRTSAPQDKLGQLNKEVQSRTSAPQDKLGQLNREAPSRTSAPQVKFGQLNKEVQSRTSAPQDKFGQLNREAPSRASATQVKFGQLSREVQSRTSAPQDKLGQLNREAQSRTSAPQDKFGQLNRETQSRTSAPQDKLGQLNRTSATQVRLSQVNTEAPLPPASSKSLFASLAFAGRQKSQSTHMDGAEGVGTAASSPAPSPLSSSGLAARDTEDKRPAPAASPFTAGLLFSSLATKRDPANAVAAPAASPMSAANILRQAAIGTHSRDRGPPEPEPQVPEFSIRKFITQMLVSHNEYRSQHKAPPLRMNVELTRHAQDWADVLALKDKMAHDPNSAALSEGENVAMKFRIGETNFPGDIFTELWYDESEAYDWEKNDQQTECGHFTQLIWKSSIEVGFGRAVSDNGRVYVVGRYKPPGNLKGEFKKNVIPSADDVSRQAPDEAQPRTQEEEVAKSPFGAVREFGAPKPRAVAFNEPADSQGGQPPTRVRQASLSSKGALKSPVATAGGNKAEGGGLLSAMLLRSTMKNKRAPDKKAVQEEQNTFNLKKFETQMLVSHNEYRALHRSPPLRLNKELSKLANDWAQALATKDKMAHDPKCGSLGLGENVAMKFRKGFFNFEGDIFTEMWYHEIDTYKWTGEDQLACGHFTQLVWRSSTEVGFGRAVSKSGRVYVVGRYKPPGNYSGQFGRNVLPPSRVMPKSRSNAAGRSTNHLLAAPDAEQQQDPHASGAENPAVNGLVPEMSGFGGTKTLDASAKGLASGTSARLAKQAAAPLNGAKKLGSARLANAKLMSGKFSTLKFGKATDVQTAAKNQQATQSGASYMADAYGTEASVRDLDEFPDGNSQFTNSNYASQQVDGLDAAAVSAAKINWHRLIGAMLTERRKTAAAAKHNWHRLGRALLIAGRKARATGTNKVQKKQVVLFVSELVTSAMTVERTHQMMNSRDDGGGNSLAAQKTKKTVTAVQKTNSKNRR